MRKFTRILIALALLGAVSQQDYGPLYRLLAFPLALVVYPFEALVVLAVTLSPIAVAFAVWLLWRRHRDGRLPGWAARAAQRVRRAAADGLARSRTVDRARRLAQRYRGPGRGKAPGR